MNIIFISLLMLHCYACCTDSDLITSQGVLVCTLRSTRAALCYKFCYGDGQLWYIDCGLGLLIVTPMKTIVSAKRWDRSCYTETTYGETVHPQGRGYIVSTKQLDRCLHAYVCTWM